MKRQLVLLAILILVFLHEVGFVCIFASFVYMSSNRGAGRTLTPEVLLSLRSTALKPDRSTRQRIVSLGCAGRRRGCRGGRAKVKRKQFPGTGVKIPVVITRHRTRHSSVHGGRGEIRR